MAWRGPTRIEAIGRATDLALGVVRLVAGGGRRNGSQPRDRYTGHRPPAGPGFTRFGGADDPGLAGEAWWRNPRPDLVSPREGSTHDNAIDSRDRPSRDGEPGRPA